MLARRTGVPAAVRIEPSRCELFERHLVLHQHFPLAPPAPIVVDAVVPADRIEPGSEIRGAIEFVERAEDAQKDLLREILRLLVPSREFVRDAEYLAAVTAHDLFPGQLGVDTLCETPLDELTIAQIPEAGCLFLFRPQYDRVYHASF